MRTSQVQALLTNEWQSTRELAGGAEVNSPYYQAVIRALRLLHANGQADRRESWRRGGPRVWVRVAEWRLP